MSFTGYEQDRINRARLMRLGFSPEQIDGMGMFEQIDLLEIDRVEQFFEQRQLAKHMAVEMAKIMRR